MHLLNLHEMAGVQITTKHMSGNLNLISSFRRLGVVLMLVSFGLEFRRRQTGHRVVVRRNEDWERAIHLNEALRCWDLTAISLAV